MRVGRNQRFLQFELQRLALFGEPGELFLAHLPDFVIGIPCHLLGRGNVIRQALEISEQADHGLEARVLLRQVTEPGLVRDDIRVREESGYLLEANRVSSPAWS